MQTSWHSKEQITFSGQKVTAFDKELERAAEVLSVILCPFYPARSLRPSQWGIVHHLNSKISKLNAAKGEGTRNVTRAYLAGKWAAENFILKRKNSWMRPTQELADAMSKCIELFIWTRIKNREASVGSPKEHAQTRYEKEIGWTERERKSSPVERQERERDDGKREKSNETGARGRSLTQDRHSREGRERGLDLGKKDSRTPESHISWTENQS